MDTSSIPRVIFKYVINEKKRRANKCDLTTVRLKSLVAREIFSLKYRLYTILLTTRKKLKIPSFCYMALKDVTTVRLPCGWDSELIQRL